MNLVTATVMAVHRERYELLFDRETIYGRLKTNRFYNTGKIVDFPTVGDEVEIEVNPMGDSLIYAVLPRKSVFSRLNATPGLPNQAVAANFDYVFIVTSLNKDFNLSKLERYVTVAWQSGGTPVIILTKLDLCDKPEEYTRQVEERAPEVAYHCVSSVTGEGFEQMEKYLAPGITNVLLGSSGVGKSSITNCLLGEREMLTGGIRESDAQGRHTTTYKQCFTTPEEIILPNGTRVKGGGRIIDTPGMRKLLVADVEDGLSSSFGDIEELISQCKFSDCRHDSEPGCAIKAALKNGTLDRKRWQTYQEMQEEEKYSKERKQRMMKRIGKVRKEMKKGKR